jgi:sulfate/thiosulfate transport system ATP-binding protein
MSAGDILMTNEIDDDPNRFDDSLPPEKVRATAISVRDIHKRFGQHGVLEGVSFDIAAGELLVVLGPSGSGKTTLLRIIAGLERAEQGEVILGGTPATNLPPQERKLGVVFQEQALFQHMTVEENIGFGLRLRKASKQAVREKVETMLQLTQLHKHRKKLPSQLSGGQRQRVAVARAIAIKPDAMLFDEPFSALDAVTRTDLRREVRAMLRAVNMAAFFITHDQEEALELADRVAVLNEGRIEQIGTPFEVYNHPKNEFVATFLGAANVLLGRVRAGKLAVGGLRVELPTSAPPLAEGQAVKLVFRPEDLVLNFQPQLLDTPYYLGAAIVDDASYIGPSERLVVRLSLRPPRGSEPGDRKANLTLVDESFSDTFPIIVSRSKWDASEMQLSPGDRVVVGLKDYRVLPHYPLHVESGAKVYG